MKELNQRISHLEEKQEQILRMINNENSSTANKIVELAKELSHIGSALWELQLVGLRVANNDK